MESIQQPKVSVIIPVYNVAPYLRECLNSVINQTLWDIEIICVNDGSTDDSPAILGEYRSRDSRIIVINQENRGLSSARNRGLKYAKGKYIYFLDSDDYVDLEVLEKSARVADENDLDAAVFGYNVISESGDRLPHPFKGHEMEASVRFSSGIEYMKLAKNQGTYMTPVWVTLWRHGFLDENALGFKEGILHEDVLFSFQAYMAAGNIVYIPEKLYYYRKRPSAITTTPVTHENATSFFLCAEGVLEYAFQGQHTPEGEHEIRRAYSEMSVWVKRLYATLSAEEKAKVVFPREIENELFKQVIAYSEGCEIDKLRKRTDELQDDLDRVHASVSYRIGRGVTWLPRKIRDSVRCYQEHGLWYTLRHTFEHLTGRT